MVWLQELTSTAGGAFEPLGMWRGQFSGRAGAMPANVLEPRESQGEYLAGESSGSLSGLLQRAMAWRQEQEVSESLNQGGCFAPASLIMAQTVSWSHLAQGLFPTHTIARKES